MDYKDNIKNILREGIAPEYVADKLPNEISNQVAEEEGETKSADEEASDEDYVEVVNKLLKNDIINHSYGRLYNTGDLGKKNEEGGTYRFTRAEIKRIKNILNDPFKQQ